MGLTGSANKGVSGVYVITNTINNMSYVGCSNNIYLRMYAHRKPSRAYISALSRAIQEFGAQNFELRVLETGQDMFDREMYWIKKLGTRQPKGYNMTDGGLGGARGVNFSKETRAKMGAHAKGVVIWTQPVYMLNMKTDKLIMSFKSMSDAARWLVKDTKNIRDVTTKRHGIIGACNGRSRTAYGYKWKYNGERTYKNEK